MAELQVTITAPDEKVPFLREAISWHVGGRSKAPSSPATVEQLQSVAKGAAIAEVRRIALEYKAWLAKQQSILDDLGLS